MTSPQDPTTRLRSALDAYPKRLALATEAADRLADEILRGYSADESVEVLATGSGSIVGVRILAPRRELDSGSLGEAVAQAANAALDAVANMRDHLAPRPDANAPDVEQAFTHKIDSLLTQLDSLTSQLDAQLESLDVEGQSENR